MQKLYTVRTPIEYFYTVVVSPQILYIFWFEDEHFAFDMRARTWKKLSAPFQTTELIFIQSKRLNANVIAIAEINTTILYNITNDVCIGKHFKTFLAIEPIDDTQFAFFNFDATRCTVDVYESYTFNKICSLPMPDIDLNTMYDMFCEMKITRDKLCVVFGRLLTVFNIVTHEIVLSKPISYNLVSMADKYLMYRDYDNNLFVHETETMNCIKVISSFNESCSPFHDNLLVDGTDKSYIFDVISENVILIPNSKGRLITERKQIGEHKFYIETCNDASLVMFQKYTSYIYNSLNHKFTEIKPSVKRGTMVFCLHDYSPKIKPTGVPFLNSNIKSWYDVEFQ
jgi:hypothetical protein